MRKKLFKTFIFTGGFDSQLKQIFSLTEEKPSSYVCVCNVHMIVEAQKDNEFNELLNNADIVTPDGMPVVNSIKYIYNIQQERVAGMDMLPDLIKKSSIHKKKIFFYGSTREVLDRINLRINIDFPNLEIEFYSPPFRELNKNEKKEIVDIINNFNPDFVFVALGCPKQEKWMAAHKGVINSCMIGFGGAFPVYAGIQKRAPKWMCDNSLEWLYRLILEPKRLFRRYFVSNSLFIWYLWKQLLKTKFKFNYEK